MINIYAWGWPQFLYVALIFIGLGICAARNGKPKDGVHSFGSDLFSSALIWAILIFGGFFK